MFQCEERDQFQGIEEICMERNQPEQLRPKALPQQWPSPPLRHELDDRIGKPERRNIDKRYDKTLEMEKCTIRFRLVDFSCRGMGDMERCAYEMDTTGDLSHRCYAAEVQKEGRQDCQRL